MVKPRRTRKEKQGPYRSGFELTFSKALEEYGLTAEYEVDRIPFIQPAQKRNYTPDWKIKDGIYIETKGRFTGADRKKMLWLRECNPNLVVYMLFMRSSVTLTKASKTTYGEWCDKNGIPWADIKDKNKWREWFK